MLISFGRYYGEIVTAIFDYLLLVAGTGLKEVSEVSGLSGLGLRAQGMGLRAQGMGRCRVGRSYRGFNKSRPGLKFL
jgi:hypothetical protein